MLLTPWQALDELRHLWCDDKIGREGQTQHSPNPKVTATTSSETQWMGKEGDGPRAPTCSTVHSATLLAVIPATVGSSLLCLSQQRGTLGAGEAQGMKTDWCRACWRVSSVGRDREGQVSQVRE